jgi:lipopolysaccharide biosynthesis glycosyltransferase
MQKSKGFKGLINEYKEKETLVSQSKPPPTPTPPPTLMQAPPAPPPPKTITTLKTTMETTAVKPKERYAFAIIHFGSNPVYLELEMYFFKMLRQYTTNDIIYLYSVNDTPPAFVNAVRPLVTDVVPFDDKHITYDVSFKSDYTNFNTLRTCNFIFAYTLKKYNKVCIIESDMVVMKNMDDIFGLQTPAVLTYYIGDKNLKGNEKIRNNPSEVIAKCREMGRINGGVMLIYPSMTLFNKYKEKIQDVVQHQCKYPNETLFEYVNNSYYNLPIQYNLSHYLAKMHKLQKYGLTPRDIYIFHFNETKYKHLDIIKNPIDENGDNWIDIIQRDSKYEVKKFPILHYRDTIYDRYRREIEPIMESLKPAKPKPISPPLSSLFPPAPPPLSPSSFKKDEIRPISSLSPPKDEIRAISPLPKKSKSSSSSSKKSKSSSSSSSSSKKSKSKSKKPRCPKGTRRNKKTGNCEPIPIKP